MINLLPPQEKELLMSQKRERLLMVLGITAMVVLLCFILILFALKFYLLQYAIYQQALVQAAEKKYQVEDATAFKDRIVIYNSNLIAADQFYKNNLSAHDTLEAIYAIARPEGLYFDAVMVEADKEKKIFKATISGTSSTRDGLVLFKKHMEENNHIANIYFPPASWVKSKNVAFYVTFDFLPKPTP